MLGYVFNPVSRLTIDEIVKDINVAVNLLYVFTHFH